MTLTLGKILQIWLCAFCRQRWCDKFNIAPIKPAVLELLPSPSFFLVGSLAKSHNCPLNLLSTRLHRSREILSPVCGSTNNALPPCEGESLSLTPSFIGPLKGLTKSHKGVTYCLQSTDLAI